MPPEIGNEGQRRGATVITLDVASDGRVEALVDTERPANKALARKSVDITQLHLYLARKNGAWLKGGDAVTAALQKKTVDPAYGKTPDLDALAALGGFGYGGRRRGSRAHYGAVPPIPVEPPVKRQRRDEDMRLADVWPRLEMNRTELPPVEELVARLQQPLPLRVTLSTWKAEDAGVFHLNAPLIKCTALADCINFYYRLCISRLSKNEWYQIYNALFELTCAMLKSHGAAAEVHRNRGDLLGSSYRLPGVVFHCDGVVLMRGEELRSTDLTDVLTSKVHNWCPDIYGHLPYILGFVAAGIDLYVAVREQTRESFRVIQLLKVNIVEQPAAAVKLFFNLALLFHEMLRLSRRSIVSSLVPFVSHVTPKRTIVMLDDRILRMVHRSKARSQADIQRLYDVYKTLKGLTTEGSDTTHLQTVQKLVFSGRGPLSVELSPIGSLQRPEAAEVSEWLRHVLLALKHWHASGYCHGDIAFSNIVHVSNDDSQCHWVLIDMDKSCRHDSTVVTWRHPFQGSRLRYEHDLFQVGELLEDLNIDVPRPLKRMTEILLEAVDTVGFTAGKVLKVLAELMHDL